MTYCYIIKNKYESMEAETFDKPQIKAKTKTLSIQNFLLNITGG